MKPHLIDFRAQTKGKRCAYGAITECPVCNELAAMSQPKPGNGMTLYAHRLETRPGEKPAFKVLEFHLVDANEMPVFIGREGRCRQTTNTITNGPTTAEPKFVTTVETTKDLPAVIAAGLPVEETGAENLSSSANRLRTTTKRKEDVMQKKTATKKTTAKSAVKSGIQAIRDLMTKAQAKAKAKDKKGAIALYQQVVKKRAEFPRKAFRAKQALQKLGVTV